VVAAAASAMNAGEDGRVRFYDCSVNDVSSEARLWEEPKLCVNAFCSVGGKNL